MDPKFVDAVRQAFSGSDAALTLGAPVLQGACHPEPLVRAPLALMNRHGLIAGATGTGKTKTLQLMAEQLSAAGVSVLLADVKGDVSGIAIAGDSNEACRRARARRDTRGIPPAFRPSSCRSPARAAPAPRKRVVVRPPLPRCSD
jgi:hypothetical protein